MAEPTAATEPQKCNVTKLSFEGPCCSVCRSLWGCPKRPVDRAHDLYE